MKRAYLSHRGKCDSTHRSSCQALFLSSRGGVYKVQVSEISRKMLEQTPHIGLVFADDIRTSSSVKQGARYGASSSSERGKVRA